jgi:hypothetical protein
MNEDGIVTDAPTKPRRTRGQQVTRKALVFHRREPRLDRSVTVCYVCGKVAMRVVGKLGFCGVHVRESFAAAANHVPDRQDLFSGVDRCLT